MSANKVDTSRFNAMCEQLSMLTAQPYGRVVKSEIAAVLSKCIQRTPKANRAMIERQIKFRQRSVWDNGDPKYPKNRGHQIGYVTKGGVQWFADEPGAGNTGRAKGRKMGTRTFHDMNGFFRWSPQRWARWQALLNEMIAKDLNIRAILRSIGVAKESWYQIAKILGVAKDVKAPAYVVDAVPQDGKTYVNGTAVVIDSPQKFLVTIENSHPGVVKRMNGASILAYALEGRAKYLEKNAEKAVFADIKKIARAYPGLKIKTT